MGGQERQLKMDKSRRFGGFTSSTAFYRLNFLFGALKITAVASCKSHLCDEMAHAISSFVQRRRWVAVELVNHKIAYICPFLIVFLFH